MKVFDYVIQDEVGMHARPASKLVQALSKYKSKVTIKFEGKHGNAKSIINLMALGLKSKSKITFEIEGEDETEVQIELPKILEKEKI